MPAPGGQDGVSLRGPVPSALTVQIECAPLARARANTIRDPSGLLQRHAQGGVRGVQGWRNRAHLYPERGGALPILEICEVAQEHHQALALRQCCEPDA
jgi:hypothetical protein